MKRFLLAAGAVLAASAVPALAKPDAARGRNQHQSSAAGLGYGVGGCPPGLAKKSPQCVPPGRAGKLFEVGQRVPPDYRALQGPESVPAELRRRFRLDADHRYILADDHLYRVDPVTRIVREVLGVRR